MTGTDAYRWLVLVEGPQAANSSTRAQAFRVSSTNVTGPWNLGSTSSVRGQGFSPDGRFFVRRELAAPAYLIDFQGPVPGDSILLSQHSGEMDWSPRAPVLLLENDSSQYKVTVVDARCGPPETYDVQFAEPARMVNPQPNWAPDGKRVALESAWGKIELVDLQSRPPQVTVVDPKRDGLEPFGSQWSPDGRWFASPARPTGGAWRVAGIDTASPHLPVVSLTQTTDAQIDDMTWASPDWLLFETSDGGNPGWTYAARVDVPPASAMFTFPKSARVSPIEPLVAYLGDCGSLPTSGICLVNLGQDGPSKPVLVATDKTADVDKTTDIGWARGGKHLNCTYWQVDHFVWWLIPNVAAGGSPVQPTTEVWTDRSWSPDSDWALWVVGDGATEKLYAYHVATASTELLLEGGYELLIWSDDGAFLAVLTADHTQVVVFAKQGNMLVELTRLESTTGSFVWPLLWQPVPG